MIDDYLSSGKAPEESVAEWMGQGDGGNDKHDLVEVSVNGEHIQGDRQFREVRQMWWGKTNRCYIYNRKIRMY